jgi:hypothetical protein
MNRASYDIASRRYCGGMSRGADRAHTALLPLSGGED